MNYIVNLGRQILSQASKAAGELGPDGWTVVCCLVLAVGWMFLKGNKVRAA